MTIYFILQNIYLYLAYTVYSNHTLYGKPQRQMYYTEKKKV